MDKNQKFSVFMSFTMLFISIAINRYLERKPPLARAPENVATIGLSGFPHIPT